MSLKVGRLLCIGEIRIVGVEQWWNSIWHEVLKMLLGSGWMFFIYKQRSGTEGIYDNFLCCTHATCTCNRVVSVINRDAYIIKLH